MHLIGVEQGAVGMGVILLDATAGVDDDSPLGILTFEGFGER